MRGRGESAWRFALLFAAACGSEPSPPDVAPPREQSAAPLVGDPSLAPLLADLKDPTKRGHAATSLIHAWAEARAMDSTDPEKPHTKRVLDSIVEPLTGLCESGGVAPELRSRLIQFLTDARDPRAEPCFKRTLQDYRPDTNEEDVTNVLVAVRALKSKTVMPDVLLVFQKMEFSRPKAKPLGAHVIDAMKSVATKSDEGAYIEMLIPETPRGDPRAEVNQGFRQQAAAYMLGHLRSEKAVTPLLKLILTPSKAPLHQHALVAMVKIGKASIAPTEALLRGRDADLAKYSEDQQLKEAERDAAGNVSPAAARAAKHAHIATAAEILGNIGAEDCSGPLLSALEESADAKTGNPTTRVIVALALAMLPRSAARIDAFKATFEATPLDLDIPGGPAKELLVSRASDFLDKRLVPWLVKTSETLKGAHEEIDPVRQVSFVSAVKLMTVDQMKDVDRLGATKAVTEVSGPKGDLQKKDTTIAAAYATQVGQAKAVLSRCQNDPRCYFDAATDPANQTRENEFTAVKAFYMIGVLGADADRDRLLKALPELSSDVLRAVCLKIIEAMTVTGGPRVADDLEGFFTKAEEARDMDKMRDFNVFLQSAARVRLR